MRLHLMLVTVFFGHFIFLNTYAASSNINCSEFFTTYQEIVRCAEDSSPEVQTANLELERARNEVQAASQWDNPEISLEAFPELLNPITGSETGISLGIPIDLGGKVSARQKIAEGFVDQAKAIVYETRAKVRSETFLKLHRLRQLVHEQEVIHEAIQTFTKLLTQYSKRPKLSPEQQISATVFKMSKSEYEIKLAETLDEIASLNSYFILSVGKGTEQLKLLTPSSFKTWPTIQKDYEAGNSPSLKLSEAELFISQATLVLAQSDAWPTLTLGPSVKLQSQGGVNGQMIGLNLSFPIPVLSTNVGGRSAALSRVRVSEVKRNTSQFEEKNRRIEFARIYAESTRVLLSTLSHQEIESRHSEIETLFFKGIVPSSLVIESHRTYVELEKARNQREIKALEALFSIYTIDGKIMEIQL